MSKQELRLGVLEAINGEGKPFASALHAAIVAVKIADAFAKEDVDESIEQMEEAIKQYDAPAEEEGDNK